MKSMKIDEIAASQDRVKVSKGAGPRPHRPPQAADPGPLKSMKSHDPCPEIDEIHEIA